MKKLLIIIMLIATSCTKKDKIVTYPAGSIKLLESSDFPNKRVLKGYKLNLNILVPRRLLVLKDFLVVSEKKADTLLFIFDKTSLKEVANIGVAGFGPGEIASPWGLLSDSNHPNAFWAQQLGTKQMSYFDAEDPTLLSKRYFRLEGNMFQAINVVWSSDTTLLGIRSDGNEKFVEYNKAGETIGTFDTWDHMLEENLPSNTISYLHQGRFVGSPDNTRFVLACINRDIIEVLDTRTKKILSIRGPLHHTPKYQIDYSPGYPMMAIDPNSNLYCYTSVFVGEYIYALFSGHTSEEINISKTKFSEKIFVFDFDGNVIDNFELDTTISDLSVDEKERKIYGITFDGDPNIVVFDY